MTQQTIGPYHIPDELRQNPPDFKNKEPGTVEFDAKGEPMGRWVDLSTLPPAVAQSDGFARDDDKVEAWGSPVKDRYA